MKRNTPMSESERAELERLRAERRELVTLYGDRGQLHPMSRMIGGLSPVSQRLAHVRREITKIERAHRPAGPKLVKNPGGAFPFVVEYEGRRGNIGRAIGGGPGGFYVVENNEIVVAPAGYKTPLQAAKAFAKFVGGHR